MHFLDEKFWLAICFIIFLYLAYRPIRKAVINSLDNKIKAIKAKIDEATNIKQDAKLLLGQVERELGTLSTLKQEILQQAQKETKMLVASHAEQLEAVLESKKAEAINEINNQKRQAYSEIQGEIAAITTQLVIEYFNSESDERLSDAKIAKNLISHTNANA